MSNATLTYICANGHRWLSPKCFCGLTAELENLSKPVKGSPIAKPKGNKYGAKKVVVDGIPFDSTVEGARYLQLRAQERAASSAGFIASILSRFGVRTALRLGSIGPTLFTLTRWGKRLSRM